MGIKASWTIKNGEDNTYAKEVSIITDSGSPFILNNKSYGCKSGWWGRMGMGK